MTPECFTTTSFRTGAPWDSFFQPQRVSGKQYFYLFNFTDKFRISPTLLWSSASDGNAQILQGYLFTLRCGQLSISQASLLHCLIIGRKQLHFYCAFCTAQLIIAFIFSLILHFNLIYWTFTWTPIFWFANKFSFFPDSSRKIQNSFCFRDAVHSLILIGIIIYSFWCIILFLEYLSFLFSILLKFWILGFP